MAESERYVLAGSERELPEGHREVSDVDPDEIGTVTVYVRPRANLTDASQMGRVLSREEYTAEFGAAPEDFEAVRRLASAHNLSSGPADVGRRSIGVSGRLARSKCGLRSGPGGVRGPRRTTLSGSHRPAAAPGEPPRSGDRVSDSTSGPRPGPSSGWGSAPTVQYTPIRSASRYSFPAGSDGTGQCVGVVELGGGYRTADLDTYFGGSRPVQPHGGGRQRGRRHELADHGKRTRRRGNARHRDDRER